MVSAIHRGVIKGLALAPSLCLWCNAVCARSRSHDEPVLSHCMVGEASPFFQTVWFTLLWVVAAGGLLGLLFALRLRQSHASTSGAAGRTAGGAGKTRTANSMTLYCRAWGG